MNIIRHIPNAITSLNLFSGCLSVVYALDNQVILASSFILLAAVFDFFDGFSARLLKAYSPIGKELDSLADVVSFGVAPGMLVYKYLQLQTIDLQLSDFLSASISSIAFLIPIFSALRLAKFNLDERQTESFIGLPTPANALFWIGLTTGSEDQILIDLLPIYVIIPTLLFFCYIMIAEVEMASLKFKKMSWKGNESRWILILITLLSILLFGWAGMSFAIIYYIGVSLLYRKNKKIS